MPAVESDVRERLSRLTADSEISLAEAGKIRCLACGHRCLIGEGHHGICRVRWVEGGRLRVPFGYVSSIQVDPIEKKPFFHVTPGARALSFGMLGCDLKCPYCQNWEISQTLRDPDADEFARPRVVTAEDLVRIALEAGATMVTSTYNEPLITSEWGVAVFRVARRAGLMTSYVSNGNGTPEVVDYIRPHVDAMKVDLKGMTEDGYRKLGGKLSAVLDTIQRLVSLGVWVEVVTLLVPGLNDSESELRDAAGFLASVSRDIPWHVTAYHDDYRMGGRGSTTSASLLAAAEIGREQGLRYVYAGNLPGGVGDMESTRCPSCREVAVERTGFRVVRSRITRSGACQSCGERIPGLWSRPS
jgi:pyruvate formate lyase activating enzyme